ncbi:MAG: hypothetical protein AUK47_08600 [Deltaproteobacteria bacterium CG2_30_63_29]|nr:MAG: hypothetical protein AUK47_08600 [Deltaproteobacteria bacterium CG2_30_63_29]
MLEFLTIGLSLLWAPERAWSRLRAFHTDVFMLVGYIVALGMLPFLFKLIGHIIVGTPIKAAVAEALLFVFVVVGTAGLSGLALGLVSRRMGYDLRVFDTQRLTLLSSTPVLVMGILYGLPVLSLHPYVFLSSLGWGAFLLLRGVWALTTLDAKGVTVVSLTGSCTWILSASLLTQVVVLSLSA